jgi:hypothetical protein
VEKAVQAWTAFSFIHLSANQINMRYITILLVLLCTTSFGQRNTAKALELANLPSQFAVYDQRVDSVTDYFVVRVIHTDFTRKNPVTNRTPFIDTTYEVRSTTKASGIYGLNYWSTMIHEFGGNITYSGDSILIDKPFTTWTVDQGPFTGYTYWYGESNVKAYPIQGGYEVLRTGNPFDNTFSFADKNRLIAEAKAKKLPAPVLPPTGTPELSGGVNPFMSITTEEYSTLQPIIKGGPKRVTKRVSNGKQVDKSTILRQTGWSYETFKYNRRQVLRFRNAAPQNDATKYVQNQFIDVIQNGDVYTAVVYINGIPADQINYRSLQTSYGKLHPSFVIRWRLYNGDEYPKDAIYGATWVREYRKGLANPLNVENQNTSITVVKGSSVNWNVSTNTLTVDVTKDCKLWAQIEELPAQGKNDGDELIFDLVTGRACINSNCTRQE